MPEKLFRDSILSLVITDAGRAAIINAANTGTNAITINQVGLGSGLWEPKPDATALKSEIKKVNTFGGNNVDNDTIHITINDTSTDDYSLGEFGLYLDDGTLFAIYSQTEPIIEKLESSIVLLATDITISNPDNIEIIFDGLSFSIPPASTELSGVVELATESETMAGTDSQKAITPDNLQKKINTISIPPASTEISGTVEIATESETIDGTDSQRVVTPDTLQKKLNQFRELLNLMFPVGHLLITTYWDNPANYGYPGSWELIGNDLSLHTTTDGNQAGHVEGNSFPGVPMQSHCHDRGNMNITGTVGYTSFAMPGQLSGCFYETGAITHDFVSGSGNGQYYVAMDAARTWTGTTSWSGIDNPTLDVRGTRIKVLMWKRIS